MTTTTDTTTTRISLTGWDLRTLLLDDDSTERNETIRELIRQDEIHSDNLRWDELDRENERILDGLRTELED